MLVFRSEIDPDLDQFDRLLARRVFQMQLNNADQGQNERKLRKFGREHLSIGLDTDSFEDGLDE